MKLISVILLAWIVSINAECTAKVCCASTCSSCPLCSGSNATKDMCCEANILAANRPCANYSAPCVSNNTTNTTSNPSIIQNFIAFVTNIPNAIFLSICLIVVIAMCYACTCFGNKKPPVPYKDINWDEKQTWIKKE